MRYVVVTRSRRTGEVRLYRCIDLALAAAIRRVVGGHVRTARPHEA